MKKYLCVWKGSVAVHSLFKQHSTFFSFFFFTHTHSNFNSSIHHSRYSWCGFNGSNCRLECTTSTNGKKTHCRSWVTFITGLNWKEREWDRNTPENITDSFHSLHFATAKVHFLNNKKICSFYVVHLSFKNVFNFQSAAASEKAIFYFAVKITNKPLQLQRVN